MEVGYGYSNLMVSHSRVSGTLPSDIAALKEILVAHQRTGETGDIVEMLAANRAFHFHIYTATDNEVLVSQIENLWLRSGPYVRYLSDRMGDLLRTSYKSGYTSHHEDMLAALESGDEGAFVQAMTEDVTATHELLFRFLSE